MINVSSKEFFAQLEGVWEFRREICDKFSAPQPEKPLVSTVTGAIYFTKASESSLYYHEVGTLTTSSGENLDVQRDLIYELDPASLQLLIRYAEPERHEAILHQLSFMHGQANHIHQCGNDKYNLTLKPSSLEAFEMRYIVSGPKKDYTTTTKIRRQ